MPTTIDTSHGRLLITKSEFTLERNGEDSLVWPRRRGPGVIDVMTELREIATQREILADLVLEAVCTHARVLAHPVVMSWILHQQLVLFLGNPFQKPTTDPETQHARDNLYAISKALIASPNLGISHWADVAAFMRFDPLRQQAKPFFDVWWQHRHSRNLATRRRKFEESFPDSPAAKSWLDRFEESRTRGRRPDTALASVIYALLDANGTPVIPAQVSRGRKATEGLSGTAFFEMALRNFS